MSKSSTSSLPLLNLFPTTEEFVFISFRRTRQREEAASLLPTPQDLLDLEDAQKRVRARQLE